MFGDSPVLQDALDAGQHSYGDNLNGAQRTEESRSDERVER